MAVVHILPLSFSLSNPPPSWGCLCSWFVTGYTGVIWSSCFTPIIIAAVLIHHLTASWSEGKMCVCVCVHMYLYIYICVCVYSKCVLLSLCDVYCEAGLCVFYDTLSHCFLCGWSQSSDVYREVYSSYGNTSVNVVLSCVACCLVIL